MKKTIQSIFIVGIFCILFGFFLTTIGLASGAKRTVYYTNGEFSLAVEENANFFEYTEEKQLSEFSDISVDVYNFDIKFSEGDSYSVKFNGYCNETTKPQYKIENGTLTIHQPQEEIPPTTSISVLEDGTIFGINNYIDTPTAKNYIIITYPKDKSFSKIQVSSEGGDTQFNTLQAKELILNQGYGTVSFEDCNFEKLDYMVQNTDTTINNLLAKNYIVDQHYGAIDLDNCTIERLNFDIYDVNLTMKNMNTDFQNKDSSMILSQDNGGVVSIKNAFFNELEFNMNSASLDMQNVTANSFKNKQYYNTIQLKEVSLQNYEQTGTDLSLEILKSTIDNLDVTSENGEFLLKDSKIKQFSADTVQTDISILKNMIEKTTIQNEYGNVIFETDEEKNCFYYDLEVADATIFINDEPLSSSSYSANSEKEKLLEISSSMGDISIKTK